MFPGLANEVIGGELVTVHDSDGEGVVKRKEGRELPKSGLKLLGKWLSLSLIVIFLIFLIKTSGESVEFYELSLDLHISLLENKQSLSLLSMDPIVKKRWRSANVARTFEQNVFKNN